MAKLDRGKSYLVYCRTGNRTNGAVKVMRELGFRNVSVIGGGITSWKEAGFPPRDRPRPATRFGPMKRAIKEDPRVAAWISAALLRWFRTAARPMAWRETRDPYRIWVSEIMLQQTRVGTVAPYYERFLLKFPDLRSLARATLDDVLKAWEGLGYYSRARNLHRAAGIVAARHGATVPRTVEALEALPGIGRSTAGAIAAIAFGADVPILDANARRVVARLFAVEGDPGPARWRGSSGSDPPAWCEMGRGGTRLSR